MLRDGNQIAHTIEISITLSKLLKFGKYMYKINI